MELVFSEEVALLLVALAALGFLVLGTLELLWPTRARRPGAPAREPRPARARAVPVAEPARPRAPEVPPAEDRAAIALRVARTLLGRAQEDPNPASERRLTLICRAIACLNRGLEAAPDDAGLRELLAAAHDALARAGRQPALRRLAVEMPWRAPALVHAAATLGPELAGATSRGGG